MDDIQTILLQDITVLKGVGESKATELHRLGIFIINDILHYYPRRYEDRRIVSLQNTVDGGHYAVLLKVTNSPAVVNAKGFMLLKFQCAEVRLDPEENGLIESGQVVDIVFFNAVYLNNYFKSGGIYRFYGKINANLVKYELVNPKFDPYAENLQEFYPIYRKTQKITQNFLSDTACEVLSLIEKHAGDLETLPEHIRREHNLCHISYALQNIHKPTDENAIKTAKERLVFEELFIYMLGLSLFKKRRSAIPAVKLDNRIDMYSFYDLLPFKLTGAQQTAINEIIGDMNGDVPMSRLLQGDVGSGKTMIAAAAVYYAVKNGAQASLMAPTEILAVQHYNSLKPLFERVGMKTMLLTGSMKAAQKREALKEIECGNADFVIGTHALIEQNVKFKNLALAVTDEQHRFGVLQRAMQADKSDRCPHALVMSATPIPRTLALIMYGDLDVSIVAELPPGRQKVDTFAVDESYRPRINNFIKRLITEGGQVFIVCPLVGDDEDSAGGEDSLKSVTQYYKKLSEEVFPDIPSGFIHGKMPPAKKDECMSRFSGGEYKILVSTIVIEVGVNVPDAVLMVVENAERFGLSQLHQLRGRVGRGDKKSYCVLFNASDSETAKARLDIMCKTNDGFEIAKKDIELRGMGDLFGEKQSGNVKFKIADVAADVKIMHDAAAAAKSLAHSDPFLENSENKPLRRALEEIFNGGEKGKIAFN